MAVNEIAKTTCLPPLPLPPRSPSLWYSGPYRRSFIPDKIVSYFLPLSPSVPFPSRRRSNCEGTVAGIRGLEARIWCPIRFSPLPLLFFASSLVPETAFSVVNWNNDHRLARTRMIVVFLYILFFFPLFFFHEVPSFSSSSSIAAWGTAHQAAPPEKIPAGNRGGLLLFFGLPPPSRYGLLPLRHALFKQNTRLNKQWRFHFRLFSLPPLSSRSLFFSLFRSYAAGQRTVTR